MFPRIILIPLSGDDRKAQAKGIRYAHGIHESAYRESVLIRSAAEFVRRTGWTGSERYYVAKRAGIPSLGGRGRPDLPQRLLDPSRHADVSGANSERKVLSRASLQTQGDYRDRFNRKATHRPHRGR